MRWIVDVVRVSNEAYGIVLSAWHDVVQGVLGRGLGVPRLRQKPSWTRRADEDETNSPSRRRGSVGGGGGAEKFNQRS